MKLTYNRRLTNLLQVQGVREADAEATWSLDDQKRCGGQKYPKKVQGDHVFQCIIPLRIVECRRFRLATVRTGYSLRVEYALKLVETGLHDPDFDSKTWGIPKGAIIVDTPLA